MIGQFYFATEKDRDDARKELEQDLKNRDVDKQEILDFNDALRAKPAWGLMIDCTFTKTTDGDDTRGKLKTKMMDSKVTRGRLSIHDCTHDDPVVRNCTETAYESDEKLEGG